ncbi:hypothetical protein QFC19_001094 [Naganishia cerealis]|uniref:Uncharacterized protein n=1 Tax=Naganishia cerealis TaxID=610337 RepID=A0ACC2WJT7_9TREE|nr:hypothetical protein QFC19_001094 [Naganishia cerealis]
MQIDETEHLRPPASLQQAAQAASSAAQYAGSALHQGERAMEHGYDGLMGAWDGYQGLQRSDNGVYSLSFPKSSIPEQVYRSQGTRARGWFGTIVYGLSKMVTYFIIYPFIVLFNTTSFLLHYISVTFLMLLTTAYYVTWPLHQIFNMVFSTFTAPMGIVWALFRWTEPLWTLFGGLLGVGATMGGSFAWIAKKMEREVYRRNEEQQEKERVRQLEWEVEQREIELERERQRADEQEKRNLVLQLQGVRHPYRSQPVLPLSRSLIGVVIDKIFGRNISLQDEFDEYYADMELLEPSFGTARSHAQLSSWDVDQPMLNARYADELDSGDEDERELLLRANIGQRPLLAPSESGSLKKRLRHMSANGERDSHFAQSRHQAKHHAHPVTQHPPVLLHHHHYRFSPGQAHLHPSLPQQQSRKVNSKVFHEKGDALSAMHTPPIDGLPPTPQAIPTPHAFRQPFMTFPAGNLVRTGTSRTRSKDHEHQAGGVVSSGTKNSSRRISFADIDEEALARKEVEQQPVEGEIFGLSDDADNQDGDEEASLTGTLDDVDETNGMASVGAGGAHMADAEVSPSGIMSPSIHLHFHNESAASTNPVSGANPRKRRLRFQEIENDASSNLQPTTDHVRNSGVNLEDKYGTPFKRSSARLGKQIKRALEQEASLGQEAGGMGATGSLFGQAGWRDRSLGEQAELDL